MSKVDKRSRRDKLKDGMVEKVERSLNIVKERILHRERENEMDSQMVTILIQQVHDIHVMCTKQDETYKTKKSDGKKA